MSTASLGCSRSSTCAMLDGMEDRDRGDPDVAGLAGGEVRRRERQELLQALVAQVRRQRPGLDQIRSDQIGRDALVARVNCTPATRT